MLPSFSTVSFKDSGEVEERRLSWTQAELLAVAVNHGAGG